MSAAADEALLVFSKEIAMSLLEKTIEGNTTSAKLLFALADGQIDCEDEGLVRSLCSLADELAAEPLWNERAACSGEVE